MSLGKERAFPTDHSTMPSMSGGLTKREYFAAMAMQGLCSIMHTGDSHFATMTPHEFVQRLSVQSVAQADALLAELEKKAN